MLRAVADTHTALWYLYADRRLSERARTVLEDAAAEGNQVGISTISLAEVLYLTEKGRIPVEALNRLLRFLDSEEGVLAEVPFDGKIAQAMLQVERAEIPDLPDRIIAATAVHLGLPLLSRDGEIRASRVNTIW